MNAEIYDRFVRENRIYAWLNRTLVELAEVEEAERILDLACGTAATTISCLEVMSARAEIVGIDASRAVIEVARANMMDPRARFEVLAAAEAHRLEGVFDRVVCNAAFWQFPAFPPVLAALARRTRHGARLVFNVPSERVVGERAAAHPFQIALMREIETATDEIVRAAPAMLDAGRLAVQAAENGFDLAGSEQQVYRGTQGELMDLMSIPAMIGPLTPTLTDEERDGVLAAARARADAAQEVAVPWTYFVLERRES